MILAIIVIGFCYLITLGILLIGNLQLSEFSSEAIKAEKIVEFSIVVPFRNEAELLPLLLESITHLKYPSEKFEVIFVDDASEDASAAIIEAFFRKYSEKNTIRYRILQNVRNSRSPKKDAISEAIKHAKYDWILTTDADCQLPGNWLKTYNAFIVANDSKFIAGPVEYIANKSFVQYYQQLDGWSLQGVTMGSFGLNHALLCNGANLGYRKDAFFEVNGFQGNDQHASGDDVFLLEKMVRVYPQQVHYLKSNEAIVTTQPQPDWISVLQQRIRWASKTAYQKGIAAKTVGVVVLFTNLLVILGPILCFYNSNAFPYYLIFLVTKVVIDAVTLSLTAQFFRKKLDPFYFLISMFIYPFITLWVVLRSFGGGYYWKGRSHKKPNN